MSCDDTQGALRRLSREPEAPISDEVALHLDVCPRCRLLFDAGKLDLDPDAFELLPEPARRAIVDSLGAARTGSRRWLPWAAAAALSLGLLAVFLPSLGGPPTREPVAIALVEDHIRYLHHPDRHAMGDRLIWERDLESYVDFPVALPISPAGRLTGVRRCFLLGQRVALAFYETPAGPASYFTLPDEGLDSPEGTCSGFAGFSCSASRGYRVVVWRKAGLLHALVGSDEATLLRLARSM